MFEKDFIIFDTSTIPEYYDDVHKILALPENHIVTYDYSTRNISDDAVKALDTLAAEQVKNPDEAARAVLTYIQPDFYTKGDGSNATDPLRSPTFQTLTRLANIVAVRTIKSGTRNRYYIDLQLRGYANQVGIFRETQKESSADNNNSCSPKPEVLNITPSAPSN